MPEPTYKEALTLAMTRLGQDPAVRFIGYGIAYGGAGGTLNGVALSQRVETTVAENLMVGMAIGMALAGLKPVVYIERFDFILNAADAIVNHLDKLEPMSHGLWHPKVIFRVVVGNRAKPLFTGATHTQDFTEAFRKLVTFPVETLDTALAVQPAYVVAHTAMGSTLTGHSTMLVEYKDLL